MAELPSTLSEAISRARVAARPRDRFRTLTGRNGRPTQARPWDDYVEDNSPLDSGPAAELADRHEGRLLHKWRHYPHIYDAEFGPYRSGFPEASGLRPLRFLEIGVSEGGSQVFWRNYFGPQAQIFGIDVDPTCAGLVDPAVAHVRIGSQADPDFLREVVQEMGGLDVVLDDGSHVGEHQRSSFAVLWPLLSVGGVYLIEDTHTSYWPNHEGAFGRPGTAIEDAKKLVDDMHRWYYREAGSDEPFQPRYDNISSVTFYDSVIAFRKRAVKEPTRFTRGTEVR